jgi:hypothetical protein
MHKAFFIVLRVVTAVASIGAFVGTLVVIFFDSAFTLLRDGFHVFVFAVKLFASGFRNSTPVTQSPHLISPALAALAILFMAMFVSVFTPATKIYLHIVAGMAVVAAVWRIHSMVINRENTLLYLPVIAFWFVHYAVCLRQLPSLL